MSQKQAELAEDFKKEFHKAVSLLTQSMSIIIPLTDEDKNGIETGLRTIESVDDDLQDAETLREFAQYVDLERLEDTWEVIKKEIALRTVSTQFPMGTGRKGEME